MRELLEAIERVKERIKVHEDKLRKNEMLTRYALVDPILRALGWDTEAPEQVVPEYSVQQYRFDYALLHNDEPLVMVEVKSLGRTLQDARDQGLRGAVALGVPFFICTNGDIWEIYDAFQPKPLDEKCIVLVHLSKTNAGDAARKLLAIWRPAMPEVTIAPSPIVEPSPPPIPLPKGISLSELRQKDITGQRLSGRLRFPDGTKCEVRNWKDLLVEVAQWAFPQLRQQGRLPLGALINRDEKAMRAPRNLNGWFLETHYSAKDCVRNAVRILEEVGVAPSSVFVEGWQPSEHRPAAKGKVNGRD